MNGSRWSKTMKTQRESTKKKTPMKSIDFGWLTTTLMRCERLFNFINRRKLNERTTERKKTKLKPFFLLSYDDPTQDSGGGWFLLGNITAERKWVIFFCCVSSHPLFFFRFPSIVFLISDESSWHMLRCIYSSDVRIGYWMTLKRRATDFIPDDSSINFLQLQLMRSTAGRSECQANA